MVAPAFSTNNLDRIAGTGVNSKPRQQEIQNYYRDESAAQCVKDALETTYELKTLVINVVSLSLHRIDAHDEEN